MSVSGDSISEAWAEKEDGKVVAASSGMGPCALVHISAAW